MYSEERNIVRINPGLASLKEVQEMRKHRSLSLVLARTLSARREGSSALMQLMQSDCNLEDESRGICERMLSAACQLHALPLVSARTGTR